MRYKWLLVISLSLNLLTIIFFLGKQYYYSHQYLFNSSKSHKAKIIVVGDSRAAQGDWSSLLQREDIKNCGIVGITTFDLVKKIDSFYHYDPKTCVIQVGINDLRNNTPIDSVFDNYTLIIDDLLKHKVRPIVTSIIPLRKDYWSDLLDEMVVNRRADSLDTKIEQLCKKKGIEYVDINKDIADNNRLKREYTFDGIHLNGIGYTLVSNRLAKYLN